MKLVGRAQTSYTLTHISTSSINLTKSICLDKSAAQAEQMKEGALRVKKDGGEYAAPALEWYSQGQFSSCCKSIAALTNCAAAASGIFLPDCALVSLIKSSRAWQATAIFPFASPAFAVFSLAVRLVVVPFGSPRSFISVVKFTMASGTVSGKKAILSSKKALAPGSGGSKSETFFKTDV